MALGDTSQNSNNQKYENSYYSRVKFNNRDEKLSLTFSFWKGMLKVSISSEKSSYSSVTYEELISIHLSPIKAMELSQQLTKFTENLDSDLFYGINTGLSDTQSIIAFGNADIEGTKRKCITIAKVDPDGTVSNSVQFLFNNDYHYALEWTNFEKMEFNKVYNNLIELDLFKTVLDEYVTSITGATSYSVLDMGRFDYSRINTKVDLIMDNLGIERKSSGGGRPNNSGNSFFGGNSGAASPQNTNRGRSTRSSIEDIEESLS